MKKSCNSLKMLAGVFALTLAVGLTAGDAEATNGYFAHGYSIKSKAMAGAGVALPLDSITGAINPAGMVDVGKRYDVGLSVFMPDRSYKGTPASAVAGDFMVDAGKESDSNYFVIPVMGGNWMLTDDSSFGVAIFGNGGMNTDYDATTFAGMNSPAGTATKPTGVDLMQLFVAPTYAKRIDKSQSFGITPIFAYQKFEILGVEPFAGLSASNLNVSNKGSDTAYGYGARIGYLGKISPALSFGAAYQTRIYMDNLTDYDGLFAEGGDFDIPSNWTVGVAIKTTPSVTVAVDVQHINYHEVNAIANPNPQAAPKLGLEDGRGFGWEDMTIFKLGVEWRKSEDLTLRAGFSHGEQPIPSSEMIFNILAPAVIEDHLTFGLTKKMGDNQELDFALMHGFENTISGLNAFNPGQTIELTMSQWEVSVGYSWKF